MLELNDIQGIIIRGYSKLPAAHFLLLSVGDSAGGGALGGGARGGSPGGGAVGGGALADGVLGRQWLARILDGITSGDHRPERSAMQIAFTYAGLKALGLPPSVLDSFPLEFEDGMTTPHKQFFLGDFAASAPEYWEWGGPNTPPVHILLMLYAADVEVLNTNLASIRKDFDGLGIREIQLLETTVLYDRKEHFGFHDGISQPTIKGLKRSDDDENCIEAGEFILGYKNEYGQYTPRPSVPAGADPGNLLPALAQGSGDPGNLLPALAQGSGDPGNLLPALPQGSGDPGKLPALSQSTAHDLGMNGSYIAFRQMKQEVPLFWKFMAGATKKIDGSLDENAMIKLASQMVGRWPDGTPLVLSPDKDGGKPDAAFDFRRSDPEGVKCPYAAHIRRSNPKDSLDTDRATSIAIAKKHRILRRGRSYGPPLTAELRPLDCLEAGEAAIGSDAPASAIERGLHFMSINADIGRQFEFLQNGWVYNQKFNGLYEERDPLIANHHNPQDARSTGSFRIPCEGLRTRITDVPEFVQIKGGGYFFIPGLRALAFLAKFKP